MAYYAVAHGRRNGIYSTWEQCQAQTQGFPNARFRKFDTEAQARAFISEHGAPSRESREREYDSESEDEVAPTNAEHDESQQRCSAARVSAPPLHPQLRPAAPASLAVPARRDAAVQTNDNPSAGLKRRLGHRQRARRKRRRLSAAASATMTLAAATSAALGAERGADAPGSE